MPVAQEHQDTTAIWDIETFLSSLPDEERTLQPSFLLPEEFRSVESPEFTPSRFATLLPTGRGPAQADESCTTSCPDLRAGEVNNPRRFS